MDCNLFAVMYYMSLYPMTLLTRRGLARPHTIYIVPLTATLTNHRTTSCVVPGIARGYSSGNAWMGLGLQYLPPTARVRTVQRLSCYGVALYLLLELLPMTTFYFLIVLFQIRVTEWIYTLQPSSSNCIQLRCGTACNVAYTGTTHNILSSILIAGYGNWNLEFFCHVVLPLCVSINI